jgi:thiamine-phosphate pyrophosphorylase
MDQKILFEIKKFPQFPVFFTDRKKISNLEETIKTLPKNSIIIIREYDLEKNEREIFAKKIASFARIHSLKILVGKDLALAKKIRADGVHFSDFDRLPLQFLQKKNFAKNFIFSFSAHNFKSILRAKKFKPDLIFISPIFPTTSHVDTKFLGIKNLAKISLKTKNSFYFPPKLYALGGINSKNLQQIRKLGIAGFGAIDLFSKKFFKQ